MFGLAKSQLWPIAEQAAGVTVTDFDIAIEHEVKGPGGIAAEKVIPTFRCRTWSGREVEVVIFAKRRFEPGPADARQYKWLREYDAPIPRMYGHMEDREGREIVFLEYLHVVTEPEPCERVLNDPTQFPDFLRATARLNAIRPVGEYADALRKLDEENRGGPQDWRARMAAAARTLDDIWKRSWAGDFGDPMRARCAEWPTGASALAALASDLLEPVLGMPTGLTHGDLYPFHTGRRLRTGEMLLFDLETARYDARFFDVSMWLGAPDEVQRRSAPRAHLAECYLAEYERRGGFQASVGDLLAESSTLWQAWTVWSLYLAWWNHRLIEEGHDPSRVLAGARDREHGLGMCRQWMHREIGALRGVLG
jgi:hypothetical protein